MARRQDGPPHLSSVDVCSTAAVHLCLRMACSRLLFPSSYGYHHCKRHPHAPSSCCVDVLDGISACAERRLTWLSLSRVPSPARCVTDRPPVPASLASSPLYSALYFGHAPRRIALHSPCPHSLSHHSRGRCRPPTTRLPPPLPPLPLLQSPPRPLIPPPPPPQRSVRFCSVRAGIRSITRASRDCSSSCPRPSPPAPPPSATTSTWSCTPPSTRCASRSRPTATPLSCTSTTTSALQTTSSSTSPPPSSPPPAPVSCSYERPCAGGTTTRS